MVVALVSSVVQHQKLFQCRDTAQYSSVRVKQKEAFSSIVSLVIWNEWQAGIESARDIWHPEWLAQRTM